MLEKIIEASVENRSYERAARELSKLAEVEVSAKQCERVTQRIGAERVAEQQEQVDRYRRLPLLEQIGGGPPEVPKDFWKGRAAVVELDGGRMQIRDERWGTPYEPGEARRHWWRETKAGCLMTFASHSLREDPLPTLPASLRDPLWAIPRFLELKRGRGQSAESAETGQAAKPAEPPRPTDSKESELDDPPAVFLALCADCRLNARTVVRLCRRGSGKRGL